jgi:hypothetical protein
MGNLIWSGVGVSPSTTNGVDSVRLHLIFRMYKPLEAIPHDYD